MQVLFRPPDRPPGSDGRCNRLELLQHPADLSSRAHGLVVLARTDHAAHLERQGAFVRAVVAFLERDPPR